MEKDQHDSAKDQAPTAKVQGEGDYEAARRYRESVTNFTSKADIEAAARAAATHSTAEKRELERAEDVGRERSKGEDSHNVMKDAVAGKTAGAKRKGQS
jgi:alpha-beta hydrolase superfamily lysophospholipase